MAVPNIADLTAGLDAACMARLGEPISYTPAGGSAATINAYVDYGDAPVDFAAGHMVDQDITVSVSKADVPVKPGSAVRLTLPRYAGATFMPSGTPTTDASGTHWEFGVKVVP